MCDVSTLSFDEILTIFKSHRGGFCASQFCDHKFCWYCPTCSDKVVATGDTLFHYQSHRPAGNCQQCENA